MDYLESLIDNLTDSQKSDFRKFLSSRKKSRNRKDLKLFDILSSGGEQENAGVLMYKEPNRNAYHAMRKRLSRRISDYLIMSRLEEDITLGSSVMGMISLARHFREQGSYRLARYFTEKAEKKALESDQFDLANMVYLFLVENADVLEIDSVEKVIRKMEANKNRMEEDERMTIAGGLVRHSLKNIIIEGREVDFEQVIRNILDRYHLLDTMIERPKLLYNILSIVRSSILTSKDFSSFEPYIIHYYEESNRKFGFGKKDHLYKVNILYMIAHVLYRNRKFEESMDYLEVLFGEMQRFKKIHFKLFYPRYMLLRAAINCYSGRLEDSISLLESTLDRDSHLLNTEERINLMLNLSIYYFMDENPGRAIRTTSSIGHTDPWYEKKMGREWVFKKSLMEIMAQTEVDNTEIALSRISWFEKRYRDMLDKPLYERATTFIKLIKAMIIHPDKIDSGQVATLIEQKLTIIPEEEEDLQAMAFYAWIKSKILKTRYYEELLRTVRPSPE